MVHPKGRRIIVLVVAVIAVAALVVGALVWSGVFSGSGEPDPYTTTQVTNLGEEADTQDNIEPDAEQDQQKSATEQVTINPEDIATIAIEPLGIRVSYSKGVGGFSFEVLRSANGTRYVEFRNESLIGTKCTDDQGTFAAITEAPADSEQEIVDETTEVDGTIYGLSLSADTCTGDPALLSEYQDAFSAPFHLLQAISE